jgi:large subunit ribosomal protein L6
MSRIGKNPIPLPKEVTVTVAKDNTISIKGPRGSLSQRISPDITCQLQENAFVCSRQTDQKRHKALHGLSRALIQNMVIGVTQGYKKDIEVIGVGFKASVEKNVLNLQLGYAHPIYFVLPSEVTASVATSKNRNPLIHIEGNDKQLVGQVCAKIKSLRKPDIYKGKGLYFADQKIRRKAGKTANTK